MPGAAAAVLQEHAHDFGMSRQATAVRVKRLVSPEYKLNAPQALLGGSDQIRVEHDANFATQ